MIVNCRNCSKEIERTRSQILRSKYHVCSNACRSVCIIADRLASKSTGSIRYRPAVRNTRGDLVPEHRYLMEQKLGRKLESWEIVHHIDENEFNNDINNLKVVTRAEHNREHFKGKWSTGSQYTDKTIYKILDLLQEGYTQYVIADKLGISQAHVSMVKNGKTRVDLLEKWKEDHE